MFVLEQVEANARVALNGLHSIVVGHAGQNADADDDSLQYNATKRDATTL
jgi:hypothetical protein